MLYLHVWECKHNGPVSYKLLCECVWVFIARIEYGGGGGGGVIAKVMGLLVVVPFQG